MNAEDDSQMQVDQTIQYESDDEVVRWDGDPEPDLSDHIKQEVSSTTNQALQTATHCDQNRIAKAQEETSKRAVILRRNELKWKLMQVSQTQNKAKLDEIKTELTYHRNKLSKAQDLAARLRDRYIRVIKSAKLSEQQLKKAETQFQNQERFVAEEKLELTKIAYDCINIGKSLYGDDYKLPVNPQANGKSCSQMDQSSKAILPAVASGPGNNDEATKDNILDNLSPFLRQARAQVNIITEPTPIASTSSGPLKSNESRDHLSQAGIRKSKTKLPIEDDLRITITKKRRRMKKTRLSALHDTADSLLNHLVTYRVISKFAQHEEKSPTDLTYLHNYFPNEFVCLPDLISHCTDQTCAYKHKSSYMKSDQEKLGEILALKPMSTFNFLLTLQTDLKRPIPGN